MYEADDDRYCYPGTTVLRNRFGLRTQIELDKLENWSVDKRMREALPKGRYSRSHYCAIHRHLFRDIYRWAGRYRQVRMSKGGSPPFCLPEYIPNQMHSLFTKLADQNCFRDLEKQPFASQVGHFLSELNAIHPFREGNGRTQNMFLECLADQAGHPLDSERIDPAELLQAMITAFHGNELPLINVILKAMRG